MTLLIFDLYLINLYWATGDFAALSKFFGGPGFSGAVICPPVVAREFAENPLVPAGLSHYLCKPNVCAPGESIAA